MAGTRVEFRCTDSEKVAWVRAAGGARRLSGWMREVLNAAAASGGVVMTEAVVRGVLNDAAAAARPVSPVVVTASVGPGAVSRLFEKRRAQGG